MKVLLKQEVPGLGAAGEVKEVAAGYARNYLIPQGLATIATPGAIRMARAQEKAQAEREARMSERAAELAKQMGELVLTFDAKAGPTGRLYGSVTTAEIAAALERELGIRFDKRKVLGDPLRQVGEHIVTVQISHDVRAEVKVVVHAEGIEEPPQEAGEEAAE